MSRHYNDPWHWFVEKVLPGLFLSIAVAIGTASFAIWKSVNELSSTIASHEKMITGLQNELQEVKVQFVKRAELLETMKRVEQQLEIMMLRAQVKDKINVK